MKKDNPTRDREHELEDDLRRLMHQKWDKLEPVISTKQVKTEAFVPFFLDSSSFFLRAIASTVFLCAYLMLFNASLKAVIVHPSAPIVAGMAVPTPEAPDSPHTPTPGNTQTNCQIKYTSQAEESLAEIAARFSVSPQAILAENKLGGAKTIPARTSLIIRSCHAAAGTSVTNLPDQTGTFLPDND